MSRAPWTPLHASLHRTLRARHLLPKNQRLLVAVSGGQDSLCLIKLLLDLQPKWGWTLAIAHCNHLWRTDADANALHVENLARTWAVPYYGTTASRSLQGEAAARQWRYAALSEVAKAHDYPYIVTGHTSSDRAETLLYNLMRGSGADGLQALSWQRKIDCGLHLIRPLLQIQRSATAQFCQTMQLPVWEDSTNQNLQYARNRIRYELLPYLHKFNPQVEIALAQTAELLQAEVEYLELAAQQLHEQARHPTEPLKLSCQVLQASPLALQRRVLRQILIQSCDRSPNFEQIEKLVLLIWAPNRTQTDPFPGGALARVENGWLCLIPP